MNYKPIEYSDQSSSPALLNIGPFLEELARIDPNEETLRATTKFIQQVPCKIFSDNPFAILSRSFFATLDKKIYVLEWIDLLEALTAKFPAYVYKEMLETIFTISRDSIYVFNHAIRLINTFCLHTSNDSIIRNITEEEIEGTVSFIEQNVHQVEINQCFVLLSYFVVSYKKYVIIFLDVVISSKQIKLDGFFSLLDKIAISDMKISDYISIDFAFSLYKYTGNEEQKIFISFLNHMIKQRSLVLHIHNCKIIQQILLYAKPCFGLCNEFPHLDFLCFIAKYIDLEDIHILNKEVDLALISYLDTLLRFDDVKVMKSILRILGTLIVKLYDNYGTCNYSVSISDYAIAFIRNVCLCEEDETSLLFCVLILCHYMYNIDSECDLEYIKNEIFNAELYNFLEEIEEISIAYTAAISILNNAKELT